jgi:hypothetical protein
LLCARFGRGRWQCCAGRCSNGHLRDTEAASFIHLATHRLDSRLGLLGLWGR